MTRRKKIVIKIAVLFFVALGLLTYFADEIDRMLLPQVKTCEPVVDYENINYRDFSFDGYVPKSAVVFSDSEPIVYAVSEYSDGETPTVYSISIEIKSTDELYYTVEIGDRWLGLTATTQLVYSTSKPLSDDDRVYIVEEN